MRSALLYLVAAVVYVGAGMVEPSVLFSAFGALVHGFSVFGFDFKSDSPSQLERPGRPACAPAEHS